MPKIPEEIGKYKIHSCLGSGGTSIVYTATHPTLKRKVVLKKLNLRGNKQHYERFRKEAALMMDLNHDNIVRVFDHFKEGSRHYIVMEFVEGCSLDAILKKGGPLSPVASRYILRCCCRAVEYIHSRNIIHRDIKPSNIFISRKGDIKLGDFGIAQLESENESSGEFVPIGTPSYMAPEQFLPRMSITKRTDVYALGVSLYEMLTAEKLFDGESLEELKKKILKSRHVSLLRTLYARGPVLYWIVRRSLFRRPGFRFSGVRPILRLLHLAGPRGSSTEARSVLTLLVDSAAGVKKPRSRQKDLPPVQKQQKKKTLLRASFLVPLLLLLLMGAGLSLSLYNGFFYRFFFPRTKGAVRIQVSMKNDPFAHAGDLHLYRDRSRFLESVRELDLSEEKSLSPLYYLDTGNYRIMVRWGSQVEWILFYLPPMAQQDEDLVIPISRQDIPRKPLSIVSSVTDGLDGTDLSARAVVSVQVKEKQWLPVENLSLLTGEAYRLKVECDGYYTRYLNVPLQFYQDVLELRVEMIPLPGQFIIEHDLEQLSLWVNGQKIIAGGGEGKELLQFGRISPGLHEWALSPGLYTLRFTAGDAVLQMELIIESLRDFHYTLQLLDGTLTAVPH